MLIGTCTATARHLIFCVLHFTAAVSSVPRLSRTGNWFLKKAGAATAVSSSRPRDPKMGQSNKVEADTGGGGQEQGASSAEEVTSTAATTTETNQDGIGKEINFVSRLNCTTGKMEWAEISEDYDYHQEIARSAYADMLHDHDRNMRYFSALRFEISRMKKAGQPAHVLDIGTGTGLLSMMAVVAGADSVFACDAFTPMLECARKVVQRNGFADKIKLIPKRSTELVIGVDLPYRCNILVTEVFDTELIGEGAIATFNHAHRELLTNPAVVIPASSTVYAQVVNSPEVERWNSLPKELQITTEVSVRFPESVSSCFGVPSVQDLQLDAIKRNEFSPLSPPIPIFQFDFSTAVPIPIHRSSNFNFKSEDDFKEANAIFLWWDLDMDTSGENVLSCQPSYVKQGPSSWFDSCPPQDAAWRDHWMHSMYFIPKSVMLKRGQDAVLCSAHDEYAFWFEIMEKRKDDYEDAKDFMVAAEHPVCECGVHLVVPRSLMYMMNHVQRYRTFENVFRRIVVPNKTVCLCISDISVLPVILARMGARKVFVVESCRENERMSRMVLEENQAVAGRIQFIKSVEDLVNGGLCDSKIDLVTGDPHFQVAVYPWNNLMFWYCLRSLNTSLLSPSVRLAPFKAIIRAASVHFTHLWKIHAPVGVAANQFDLVDFDDLIKASSCVSDSPVDAQPLWEYETTATSLPVTLLEFDMSTEPSAMKSSGHFEIPRADSSKPTNGIAIWVDWVLDDSDSNRTASILSTGPKNVNFEPGEIIEWERFSKQGVYFIDSRKSKNDGNSTKINYSVSFDSDSAEFSFNFSLV